MIDTSSPAWGGVVDYIDSEIRTIAKVLESPRVNELDTQFHRGKINALRTLKKYPSIEERDRRATESFQD